MDKRRSRGEGTIFFSPERSRWIAQITLPNGRKRTRLGKTQGEVKKWLLEQRRAVQQGAYLADETHTLESFLHSYIEDVASQTLSPRTVLSYSYLIKNHIVPEIGKLRLSQLRPEHLQALYARKLNVGLSRRTVRYIHHFLHSVLQIAYKWGLVLRNVADLADPPASEGKTATVLTAAQARQLFDVVRSDRLYPLYVCAVSLGLRQGELLALEWQDVDFEHRTLSVSKQLQYIPRLGLLIKPPKTRSSIRTLPLPDITYAALMEHRAKSDSRLVFATANNTPFSPRNILRHFHMKLAEMGLPKMAFHNLRHSCASFHLAAGTNPKVVQELLGHSNIGITLSIYSHVLPCVQEEAARKINSILS
jgi:integrase